MLKPHIKVVDEFLNHLLIPNSVGKAFVDLYYTYSPSVAGFIARNDALTLVVLLLVVMSATAVGCLKSLGLKGYPGYARKNTRRSQCEMKTRVNRFLSPWRIALS